MKVRPTLTDEDWREAWKAWGRWDRIHRIGGETLDEEARPILQGLLETVAMKAETSFDLFLCLCACLGAEQATEIVNQVLYDQKVLGTAD